MILPQRAPSTRRRFLLAALLWTFVAIQFGLQQAGVVAASERVHFAIPFVWLAWTFFDPVRRARIKRPQVFAWLLAVAALGALLRLMDTYGSDYPAWTLSVSESLLRVWFALSLCAIFGRLHAGFGWLLHKVARKSEGRRVVGSAVAALGALLVFFPYQFTFWSVHRPHHANLANPRQAYHLNFQNVTFPAANDGLQLRGWFVPAQKPTNATVVVCHGIGANQSVFSGVLPFLHRAGFNVLTFDFRGHGDSNGHTTSFGYYEARDVRGAVAYLKNRGQTRVALYGFSMGGAAVLLSTTQLPDLRAVVVDSTFADFAPLLQAQTGSSSFLGRALPTLARAFGHLELGFDAGEIAPRRAVAKLSPRPIFIIHGLADKLIPVSQARENFRTAYQPKQIMLIPGAGHCRGRLVNPGQYEPRVAAFLRAAFAAATPHRSS